MKHIGRIKVIQDNEDIVDCICICPHCGSHVLYGNMFMMIKSIITMFMLEKQIIMNTSHIAIKRNKNE